MMMEMCSKRQRERERLVFLFFFKSGNHQIKSNQKGVKEGEDGEDGIRMKPRDHCKLDKA